MAYPKKLLRLRPTQGIVVDTPASETGPEFYTGGRNVIFRKGFAGRIRGSRNVYEPALYDAQLTSPVTHIRNVQAGGTNYWLVFTADGDVYALEGMNANNISPYPALAPVLQPYQYSSALLNGVAIITNGQNELMYWDGSNPLDIMPDWTPTESCKSVAVLRYHVFALDIDGPAGAFPSLLRWSAAAEPGTVPSVWTPAGDNDAGNVELSDSPGALLCAAPLRDLLMIYKKSATYAAQHVGGNQVFACQKLQSSSGALTRHSVCDVNGQHFVVSDGDIVLTDGVNRQSIGQSRMKDWLFNNLDQTNYENLFVTYNRPKNEVLVSFPAAGSELCNLALVYDIANDAFGVRDLPSISHAAIGTVNDDVPSDVIDDNDSVIDDVQRPFNVADLSAATESLVFGFDAALEMQDTEDASLVEASLAKYDLTFDAPERVKFVKRLHVRAEPGFGSLLVRVGARMTPTDTITWSNEVTLAEPDQIVNCFAQGRYISVEIRSNSDRVWTVTGVDIEAELRGYF